MLDCEKDIILDSITEGVFTIDLDWRINSFNRAAEEITGIPRGLAIGRQCKDILKASICAGSCALGETMISGKPVVGKTLTILDARGERRPVSISTAILRDQQGRTVGGVEIFRDLTLLEQLRKEVEKDYGFEDIISRSRGMQDIFNILPEVADSASTVLIEGESGTGKELFARAIHNLSPRRDKPFVAVNCGGLPETLLESEFFGYMAGAFTDARKDKPGRIALAEGGTLFLDEIGEISMALQVRLLRFFQEREYEPLGSITTLKADVRVITATNKKLEEQVKKGDFRQDFFYRVNVVKIVIPPLNERMEDIPLLVDYFISRLNLIQKKEVMGISDDALACLMSHNYPGNVRELENIIERAFVLCRSGEIERKHLPETIGNLSGKWVGKGDGISFRQVEAAFLYEALEKNNWNRVQTARQLGIHKTTLFRKIKSLGIELPPNKRRHPNISGQ